LWLTDVSNGDVAPELFKELVARGLQDYQVVAEAVRSLDIQ